MAKKKPWLKFHPLDWLGDPHLRLCSLEAKGLLIDIMSLGHLGTGCDEKRFTALDDSRELGFHGVNLRLGSRPINLQSHDPLIS